MDVIQVKLPDELQEVIDRQVAEGRIGSGAQFLVEAARRYAEDLDLEDEIIAQVEAGIADAEAGRYRTIATPGDAEAYHEHVMTRLRTRLDAENG
jgi:predicted transcriptional regulator